MNDAKPDAVISSFSKGENTRRWLVALGRKDTIRPPKFSDAFFGDNPFRYLWSRLRFYSVNQSFIFCLHILEFFLLSRALIGQFFITYILMTHLTTLIPSAFWGFLEGQRSALNQEISISKRNKIISDWYNFSWLCFFVVASGYVCFYLSLNINKDSLIKDSALILLGVVNLFDMVSRSRYSAIFAQVRVYRPQVNILKIEALSFAINILLFFTFKSANAILWGVLLSKTLVASIGWHYTSRAYSIHRLAIPTLRMSKRKPINWPAGLGSASSWNHLFYMLMQRASSVFIVLVLYQSRDGALPLVFHVISPLMSASVNWVQIFYFDFRKFRFSPFQLGMRHYERPMLVVGLLIVLSASILAIATLGMTMSWQIQVLYLPLVLFICFRGIAGSRFFLKFDQKTFLISGAYFCLTVLLPILLTHLGDFGDRDILIFMTAGHVVALLGSYVIGSDALALQIDSNIVLRSAERYHYLRDKVGTLATEFSGVIDLKLTSVTRFADKLRAFGEPMVAYVDRSGRFFIRLKEQDLILKFVRFFMGDVASFRTCKLPDWNTFYQEHTKSLFINKENLRFFEIFAEERNGGVHGNKLLVKSNHGADQIWPFKRTAVESHDTGIDFGDLFHAARRSALSGRMVKLRCESKEAIYIFSSTAHDGLVSSVKLAINSDEKPRSS
jgi:hypothetical protein